VSYYVIQKQVGYDYSGYGMCTGTPTDRQTYEDIDAVLDWCLNNIPGKAKIVLYGQSVGSGPSCYLATSKRRNIIAGLILHSPILSGVRVLSESRGILACFDIFPNIDRIQRVRCPVFIMHGKEDLEVRFCHGTRLQTAVPSLYQTSPWWVPQRGHNNLTLGYESEYFRRLSMFLNSITHSLRDENSIEIDVARSYRTMNSYMKAHPVEDDGVCCECEDEPPSKIISVSVPRQPDTVSLS
jgi:pimeloyl-ACP methyl ester carboxylesterase